MIERSRLRVATCEISFITESDMGTSSIRERASRFSMIIASGDSRRSNVYGSGHPFNGCFHFGADGWIATGSATSQCGSMHHHEHRSTSDTKVFCLCCFVNLQSCFSLDWLAVLRPAPKPATDFPDLRSFDLEGTLPELHDRVVLVDFWASWCGPCKASFPAMEALNKRYTEQGVGDCRGE